MFGGSSFNPSTDIPDLSGKVILVTGGNSGLGAESVLQLAKHGPKEIFLGARSRSKAEEAIKAIKATVPDANITFLEMDLASFKSVANAAETFKRSSDRLDILINNAGIMMTPADVTQEGYEVQFGTNHMGHALLTKLLLPVLEHTTSLPGTDVRVVNLSSTGHQMAPKGGIVTKDLCGPMQDYYTNTRYGQAKLANLLFTRELARRYPAIKSIAVHPGLVKTNLAGPLVAAQPWLSVMFSVANLAAKSVEKGALTQLWASTSKDAVSGEYYVPVATRNAGSSLSQNRELAESLWKWTEDEISKHGY